MTDDKRTPPHDPTGADHSPKHPGLSLQGYEQLTLDGTVTGPGMRTEDHYEPGTKLKIRGERGTFTYRYASISKAGLVSLHLQGQDGFRAVRPAQVTPLRKRRP